MPIVKFIASTVHQIKGSAKIPKMRHVTPTWLLLTKFCIFFSLELIAIRVHAKFDVSIASTVTEIPGVPKFQKWVT